METAIATLLVGGLFVVAMNLVGASKLTQSRYADREQALILAEDLLNEILSRPYEDPDGGVVFGIELGESLNLHVSLDDADDYHNFTESPPTDASGNTIPGAERFTRKAVVYWVEADAPVAPQSSETGVKRVVVQVLIGEKKLAQLTGLMTSAWPNAEAMAEGTP
ncbi:MAG: hypothetical protein AAGA25_02365 [Planctomycetota bacterium]